MPALLFLLTAWICPAAAQANPTADVRTLLEQRSLAYFLENTHPETGLVRDRAHNFAATPDTPTYRRASVAATGFGMAVLAHAAKRGWVAQATADGLILRALRTVAAGTPVFHGWLYHFVDWETAERLGTSEISTVDTAWLVAGALYAGAVTGNAEIAALADAVYRRLDFDAMRTDGGTRPDKMTLSMGYLPESGYLPWNWDAYAEHGLLVLLGLGHPDKPLPAAAWAAWTRQSAPWPAGGVLIGPELPLFAHQYTQLFVDLRPYREAFGSYAVNSARATRRDKDFCRAASHSATFRAGFWGLSASDGPDGYRAYSVEEQDGTVCLACAGASAMFLRDEVLADLAAWASSPLSARILGRYGFADGINLDRNWVDEDVIGITVGALYLGLANSSEATAVWPVFGALAPMQRGLEQAFGRRDPSGQFSSEN